VRYLYLYDESVALLEGLKIKYFVENLLKLALTNYLQVGVFVCFLFSLIKYVTSKNKCWYILPNLY
jgi:hypothetical protein